MKKLALERFKLIGLAGLTFCLAWSFQSADNIGARDLASSNHTEPDARQPLFPAGLIKREFDNNNAPTENELIIDTEQILFKKALIRRKAAESNMATLGMLPSSSRMRGIRGKPEPVTTPISSDLIISEVALKDILRDIGSSPTPEELNERISRYWNFKFFENLPLAIEQLGENNLPNEQLYNIESFVALSLWIQLYSGNSTSTPTHGDFEKATKLIAGYQLFLSGSSTLNNSQKSNFIEAVEEGILSAVNDKVSSNDEIKNYFRKIRFSGRSLRVFSVFNSIQSLLGLMKTYGDALESKEVLGKKLEPLNNERLDSVKIFMRN
jgi:hypothetical protein